MPPTFITTVNQKSKAQFTHMNNVLSFMNTTKTRVVLISLVVLLGLGYLWLVNSSATAGFYLSDLERDVVALEDEYQKLELEKTALQSLDHIREQSEGRHMVASGSVEYASGDTSVALSGE